MIARTRIVTEDGSLSDEEVTALQQWAEDHEEADLPARAFLLQTVQRIVADGVVTADERGDLWRAIGIVRVVGTQIIKRLH